MTAPKAPLPRSRTKLQLAELRIWLSLLAQRLQQLELAPTFSPLPAAWGPASLASAAAFISDTLRLILPAVCRNELAVVANEMLDDDHHLLTITHSFHAALFTASFLMSSLRF